MITSDWNGVVVLCVWMRERHKFAEKRKVVFIDQRKGHRIACEEHSRLNSSQASEEGPSDDICLKSFQVFAVEEIIPKTKGKPSITASSPIWGWCN